MGFSTSVRSVKIAVVAVSLPCRCRNLHVGNKGSTAKV